MWTKVLFNFKTLSYKYHITIGLVLRLIVVAYGEYHDLNHSVAFTDVDYKVFTDAARHTWDGSSPYARHTYRYTPIIALLLIPNVTVHHCFGKFLFCIIDILVAILICTIVKHCLVEFEDFKQKHKLFKQTQEIESKTTDKIQALCNVSMFFWLYNPFTISIAARGNCDSLAALLVLYTLYLLQCKRCSFWAGIAHGLAIHVRLYPIMYSLSLFMFLSRYSFYFKDNIMPDPSCKLSIIKQCKTKKTIFKTDYLYYFIPNFQQAKLMFGCFFSLTFLTMIFYLLYGEQFLYESVIYHLIRKDTRHNFSLYFYLQYLSTDIKHINVWQKVLTVFPQLLLILVFSIRYGLNKISLNFCILIQTIVMVSYNTVVTSQYFVWILSVLPLCVWQINIPIKHALFLLFLWIVAQITWLLPAYLLEFQGQNTFLFIWSQSVAFFCANLVTLGRLIKYFMFFKWEHKLL